MEMEDKEAVGNNGRDLQQSPNYSQFQSPGSKRAASYNYWKPKGERVTGKRLKLIDEETEGTKRVNSESKVIKISDLKTGNYVQECIKARITLKNIFEKEKEGGMSKTMSFCAIDHSGEIAGVVFSTDVPQFDESIQVNQCVEVENFVVAPLPPAFRTQTGHDYQIKLNRKSTLKIIGTEEIPEIPFQFTKISEILKKEKGEKIDVLAIVAKNWGIKGGVSKQWRNLTITDDSGQCILLTLWNRVAVNFGDQSKVMIAIRKGCVDVFDNEKSINTYSYTLQWKNPVVAGSESLQQWFDEMDDKRESSDDDLI